MTCDCQVCRGQPHDFQGGAMGYLLKSYGPYRYEYDGRSGLTLELHIRFRVTRYCKSRRYRLMIGKYELVVENTEIK